MGAAGPVAAPQPLRDAVAAAWARARQGADDASARARLPAAVRIVEVSPRDGLQNEQQSVPTATKVALVHGLAAAGLACVEMTGFVSPRRVPQLADAADVVRAVERRPGVRYPVLVPNMRGFQLAAAAGATELALCASAAEQFSVENIGCGVPESLKRFGAIAVAARGRGMVVRGYVSCITGSPFEGDCVEPGYVAEVARALYDMGCFEISLGDTIGSGTPHSVTQVVEAVLRAGVPGRVLAIHCHDTHGTALENVLAALLAGVTAVDSSVAGLGGCPFAPGAAGNVSTEDCVYMLQDVFQIDCGNADLAKLIEVGNSLCASLGRPSSSKIALQQPHKKDYIPGR
jgi:hydroxymethylglutaryl-CoA lyase